MTQPPRSLGLKNQLPSVHEAMSTSELMLEGSTLQNHGHISILRNMVCTCVCACIYIHLYIFNNEVFIVLTCSSFRRSNPFFWHLESTKHTHTVHRQACRQKKTHTHKIKTNKSIRFIYYIAVLRVLYVGCLVLVRMGQATLEATDTRISQRCSLVNNLQLAASLACAQHLSMVPRNHCSQGSEGGESCICWEMILIAVCAPPDRGCQVATPNFKQARSSRL